MLGKERKYTEPNSFELIFRLLLKITVDWVYQCELHNFLMTPRGLLSNKQKQYPSINYLSELLIASPLLLLPLLLSLSLHYSYHKFPY